MTKRLLTPKVQEQLKCNPYVRKVSEKSITYSDEFKCIFISENEKVNYPVLILKELD